jgi:hypothetical protein
MSERSVQPTGFPLPEIKRRCADLRILVSLGPGPSPGFLREAREIVESLRYAWLVPDLDGFLAALTGGFNQWFGVRKKPGTDEARSCRQRHYGDIDRLEHAAGRTAQQRVAQNTLGPRANLASNYLAECDEGLAKLKACSVLWSAAGFVREIRSSRAQRRGPPCELSPPFGPASLARSLSLANLPPEA